ncbi:MAG: hypothetical protein ACYDHE_16985 [Candidatus Acidiferrales bacterium]
MTVDVVVPVPRLLRNKAQDESNAIYESLKQIAEMSNNDRLIPYQNDEIRIGRLHRRHPGLRGTEFGVFSGITCEHAQAPIVRGFTITPAYSRQRATEDGNNFLANIHHPRFLELKKATGGNHCADLYHLWEAEHNALDCFITLDVRFINAVTNPKPLKTSVKVGTPIQFVKWISKQQSVRSTTPT